MVSSYLRDLGWACIAAGAAFSSPALLRPARHPRVARDAGRTTRPAGRQAPAGRQSLAGRQAPAGPPAGTRRAKGDGWPDLRTCLTVMAIGLSLLSWQWNGRIPRLAGSIPLFAVVLWNAVSWLAHRARPGPARGGPARPPSANQWTAPRIAADERFWPPQERPAGPGRRAGDGRGARRPPGGPEPGRYASNTGRDGTGGDPWPPDRGRRHPGPAMPPDTWRRGD